MAKIDTLDCDVVDPIAQTTGLDADADGAAAKLLERIAGKPLSAISAVELSDLEFRLDQLDSDMRLIFRAAKSQLGAAFHASLAAM